MKKTGLILLVFLSMQYSLHAQWQSCSPFDSVTVRCLLTSGVNIFAGTDANGVFMTSDDGSNWLAKNSGLSNLNINAITADTSGNLFAGSNSIVLFTSSDTGNTWTSHNMGGTGTSISSLAIYGTKIFAGQTGDGVFMSSNNGSTWMEVGLCCASVLSLCSDTNGYVFAGTNASKIYRSNGTFLTWTQLTGGLPGNAVRAIIKSNGLIFAGTYGAGIYVSSDNGDSWSAVNSGLSNLNVISLTSSGNKLLAGTSGGGIFLSVNNGLNWMQVNDGLNFLSIPSMTTHGSYAFAGVTNGGVWKRPLAELTGTQEYKDVAAFKLFPVPASETVTLELSSIQNTYIQILGTDGRLIKSFKPKNQKSDIDISDLPRGFYLLKVQNEAGLSTIKMLKL